MRSYLGFQIRGVEDDREIGNAPNSLEEELGGEELQINGFNYRLYCPEICKAKKGEGQEWYRVHISMDPQKDTHTKPDTRSGSIQRPQIAQVSAESSKRLEFTPCSNSHTGGKRSPPPTHLNWNRIHPVST